MVTPHNFIDLTGQVFGKLTVISRHKDNTPQGNARWKCVCECGCTAIVNGAKLKNGHTKSCGCIITTANKQSHERLYRIWKNMNRRCKNPSADNYSSYGGRGIRVCDEWNNYESFKKWALCNGYKDNLSIDRIDVNGDYTPSNCRWANQTIQMNNIRSNVHIDFNGKSFTKAEFARFCDLPYYTVINQIRLGWSTDRIYRESKIGVCKRE